MEIAKLHGYVTRDFYADPINGTGLILHGSFPTRHEKQGEWSNHTIAMHIPDEYFPSVTWENSNPMEVDVYIIPKYVPNKIIPIPNEDDDVTNNVLSALLEENRQLKRDKAEIERYLQNVLHNRRNITI